MTPCLFCKDSNNNRPLFYGHYTGQPTLAGTYWKILLVPSFTAHMPLLTALTDVSVFNSNERTNVRHAVSTKCKMRRSVTQKHTTNNMLVVHFIAYVRGQISKLHRYSLINQHTVLEITYAI